MFDVEVDFSFVDGGIVAVVNLVISGVPSYKTFQYVVSDFSAIRQVDFFKMLANTGHSEIHDGHGTHFPVGFHFQDFNFPGYSYFIDHVTETFISDMETIREVYSSGSGSDKVCDAN